MIPWRKPWVVAGGARSHATGNTYSLLNQLLLGGICGEFITFRQVQKEGGLVKQGAKSFPIVFWKILDKGENLISVGETVIKKRKYVPYLHYYRVFAMQDVEGIQPKFDVDVPNIVCPEDAAEKVWRDYVLREEIAVHSDYIRSRAFYNPEDDAITIPSIKQFFSAADYYSTVFHEVVHSTGHRKRLNRPLGWKGTAKYAQEELTAEIGACALLAHLGLETESSQENTAAYIKFWRDQIAEDNTLIVLAAGRAQKAIELILNMNPDPDPDVDFDLEVEAVAEAVAVA